MAENIQFKNQSTLREKIQQAGKFDLKSRERVNPETGATETVYFVVLGVDVAYPSHKAVEILNTKGITAIDELKYAEVQAADGRWVPCIMSSNGGATTLLSIKATDL